VTATAIWYVQVGALALYRNPREAVRSQYWMLIVMIGFTSLGLWLLSALTS
jgi:hypothetical protein